MTWAIKDPNDVVDYTINWAADQYGRPGLTAGDPLQTSTWIVPTGIIKDADNFTTTTTTIWFSGGSTNTTYPVTNRVTTQGGRSYDKTVNLRVEER